MAPTRQRRARHEGCGTPARSGVSGSQHPISAATAEIAYVLREIRRVAPGAEPVKGAPSGPPSAGPDGPPLTEPAPSAEGLLAPAGWSLPEPGQHEFLKGSPDMRAPHALDGHTPRTTNDEGGFNAHSPNRRGTAAPHASRGRAATVPEPRPQHPRGCRILRAAHRRQGGGATAGVPHTWQLAQARVGRIPHHRLGHHVRFSADDLKLWLQETHSDDGAGRRA
jgi:hypothetical protein